MFDFSKLLDIEFLTEANPAEFASKNLFLIVFGLIILISVLLWVAAHFLVKRSQVLKYFLQAKLFYLLFVLGAGGMLLTLLRSVGAAYLSMRLVFLIFLLTILVWAIHIVFYLLMTFTKEYQDELDYQRKKKYWPRKKQGSKK